MHGSQTQSIERLAQTGRTVTVTAEMMDDLSCLSPGFHKQASNMIKCCMTHGAGGIEGCAQMGTANLGRAGLPAPEAAAHHPWRPPLQQDLCQWSQRGNQNR